MNKLEEKLQYYQRALQEQTKLMESLKKEGLLFPHHLEAFEQSKASIQNAVNIYKREVSQGNKHFIQSDN